MTSAPPPVSAAQVLVRPIDLKTERKYLHSTARSAVAAFWGDRYTHYPTIAEMVDQVLATCETTVAHFAGDDDVMGYVARGPDGAVEFLYLRRALVREGAVSEIKYRARQAERDRDAIEAEAARKALAGELRVASDVARALLPEQRVVVLRRSPKIWILDAVALAGCMPTVIPRGI